MRCPYGGAARGSSCESTRRWVPGAENAQDFNSALTRPPTASVGPVDSVDLAAARERTPARAPPGPPLAAPGAGHRTGDLGQARENQPDRRVQKVRGGVNFAARLVEGARVPGLVSASRGKPQPGASRTPAPRSACRSRSSCREGNWPGQERRHPRRSRRAGGPRARLPRPRARPRARRATQAARSCRRSRPWLVEGVAAYAAELHEDVPDLDVVYMPVGMGSGICANIAVRDLLGRATEGRRRGG